jgi:hypothetical protein
MRNARGVRHRDAAKGDELSIDPPSPGASPSVMLPGVVWWKGANLPAILTCRIADVVPTDRVPQFLSGRNPLPHDLTGDGFGQVVNRIAASVSRHAISLRPTDRTADLKLSVSLRSTG